ncbi:MAG: type II toxin-antitoxin system mRNA interferase toxin, RelE/StbE family [Candidatus Paceibacterota bacterium]|jgi:mRNA interferase YafQ
MLELTFSKPYKKALKKLIKSGDFDKKKLIEVINKLLNEERLEEKYQDHGLNGGLSEHRDCHVCNDLVLIYKINKQKGVLVLSGIGTHSELFG